MKMTKDNILAPYKAELQRMRELLDAALGQGATSSSPSEDRVIFPLLVTCRDLVEEILFLVSEHFGRAAVRTARTMYECIVVARHHSLHPEKVDDYLGQFHAQWAKIL